MKAGSSEARRSSPLRYGAAVVVVAAAVWLRLSLDPLLGERVPFSTLFLAVVITAWYSGLGPALLAVGLGALGGAIFILPPRGQLVVSTSGDAVSAGIFVLLSCLIVMMMEGMRRARRRAEDTAQELTRSAAATREQEVWLRVTMASIGDAVIATDTEGRIRLINPIAAALTGWSQEDAAGRSLDEVFKVISEETREAVESPAARVLRRSSLAGMGHHPLLVDRNGVERSIEESASPIRDGAGQASGVVLVFRDVTERRRAELRLKTSEETVRSLLRVSTKLNSSLNVDELLDILVEEALQLAGAENGVSGLRTPEGMTCQRYFMRGRPMLLNYCWPPRHGLPGWVLVNKRPYLTNDAATDGQIVPELRDQFGVREALSIPILDVRGEVLGFFELHNRKGGGGFTPTDQEQLVAVSQAAAIAIQNALAFRKLQQAEAALKEADRRKDEFLATLAHELRNPLAPIRNALQIMRLCDNDPQTVERVRGVMERQLSHMVRLIDDLLDVSRITRNKLELRRERVDLSRVVQAAVETARPLIDSREQRLTVTLPTEPISLDADLTRLAQVFANLLNNAAKYTRPKGELWLTVLRRPSEVVVTVRDNGIGFTQEQRARLFQMFTQASASPDQAQSGLGIGLALARGLVEMHGGTIEANSNGPGLGSEFTVRLPAPSRVDAQGAEGAPIEKAQPHERRRILVVDDNRDAAESLAMMLQLLRHEVRVAHDGVEAIEATAAFRPDVVLLDIGMPRMNGYEAARHIRKQPGGDQVVLIALTGWGQAADKQLAMEAGFDLHLTKPVDPSLLVKRLSEVQQLRR